MIRFPSSLTLRRVVAVGLPHTERRCFSPSTLLKGKETRQVPVTTFANNDSLGKCANIDVEDSLNAPPVSLNEDVGRAAAPFDSNIVPRMTPTMKMFTLEGKVALVIGWAFLCC